MDIKAKTDAPTRDADRAPHRTTCWRVRRRSDPTITVIGATPSRRSPCRSPGDQALEDPTVGRAVRVSRPGSLCAAPTVTPRRRDMGPRLHGRSPASRPVARRGFEVAAPGFGSPSAIRGKRCLAPAPRTVSFARVPLTNRRPEGRGDRRALDARNDVPRPLAAVQGVIARLPSTMSPRLVGRKQHVVVLAAHDTVVPAPAAHHVGYRRCR